MVIALKMSIECVKMLLYTKQQRDMYTKRANLFYVFGIYEHEAHLNANLYTWQPSKKITGMHII